mmetsp:Transcript_30490/g.72535  ORF Transcript_30490/g.72535 Transcript_30490/m.72535 type:complete len:270 (+) Transcript_30490:641-1450(+)
MVCRDVHAVVCERGGAHKKPWVDILPENVQCHCGHHIVQPGVLLQLTYALCCEDDHPCHELPDQASGLDRGEKQVTCIGVIPCGKNAKKFAEPSEAPRVHHVVHLACDPSVFVFRRQIRNHMNLAVVVEPHGVTVGEAPPSTFHGEVGLDLYVFVHREHHAINMAERIDRPRAVAVLGVKHSVRVVVVVARRDIDLIHRRDSFNGVRIRSKPLLEHAENFRALHDMRERVFHIAVQFLVPPVSGAIASRVFLGDEIHDCLHRFLVIGVG